MTKIRRHYRESIETPKLNLQYILQVSSDFANSHFAARPSQRPQNPRGISSRFNVGRISFSRSVVSFDNPEDVVEGFADREVDLHSVVRVKELKLTLASTSVASRLSAPSHRARKDAFVVGLEAVITGVRTSTAFSPGRAARTLS
jgi:hypothetical protein